MGAVRATPQPQFIYRAAVLRIIDADTLDVEVDLGIRTFLKLPLRVYGIDAPERYTPEGKEAIDYVSTLLGSLPKEVVVETIKPTDKYGRYLANVFIGDLDLGSELIQAGYAEIYLP